MTKLTSVLFHTLMLKLYTKVQRLINIQCLRVKNLLLYHTEDKTLATRKERYAAEAASQFSGKVYVPDDLEEILLRGNE